MKKNSIVFTVKTRGYTFKLTFTCSKSTMEILEKGVKASVFCFYCRLCAGKCWLGYDLIISLIFHKLCICYNLISRLQSSKTHWNPENIYLLKVNNINTRKRCELRPNLIIRTTGQRQQCQWQQHAICGVGLEINMKTNTIRLFWQIFGNFQYGMATSERFTTKHTFTCSKSTIEAEEKGVKYVQSKQ